MAGVLSRSVTLKAFDHNVWSLPKILQLCGEYWFRRYMHHYCVFHMEFTTIPFITRPLYIALFVIPVLVFGNELLQGGAKGSQPDC